MIKGNDFWKKRTKHGRDRIFSCPDVLMETAKEYFQWCERNPWYKNEAIKSGDLAGTLVQVPTQRPYTLAGFCVFIGVNSKYFTQFKSSIIEREDDESKSFLDTIEYIETVMYTNKFEGATVGAFNANIISRDLGLVDKSDLTLEPGQNFTMLLERAQQQRRLKENQDEQIQ